MLGQVWKVNVKYVSVQKIFLQLIYLRESSQLGTGKDGNSDQKH